MINETNPLLNETLSLSELSQYEIMEQSQLDQMQLHIEDLIFRWTRAGAPLIPSMKDSILRFWNRLSPKFLDISPQKKIDSF
jgi:hypothetical protein